MKDIFCVVVADGTRARFLTFDANRHTLGDNKHVLVEQKDLVNMEHKLSGREKFTNTRTGSNKGTGGTSHSYDDHRDQSDQERERRFAQEITSCGLALAERMQAGTLLLVSEKKMLGLLRKELSLPAQTKLDVKELAKNLAQLSLPKLHDYLANEEYIPRRQQANLA